MIGYFIRKGGPETGRVFNSQLNIYKKYIEKYINIKKYGNNLSLILIQYYISGKFLEFNSSRTKLLNYLPKEKAIAFIMEVDHKDFLKLSDEGQKKFIIKTTLNSVLAVKKRLEKKNMDIDFNSLVNDLNLLNDIFYKKELNNI